MFIEGPFAHNRTFPKTGFLSVDLSGESLAYYDFTDNLRKFQWEYNSV